MFNLGCDTDLEQSNLIFSQDISLLMMIYHQTEFGCKRLIGLELIKDIAESHFDYISSHCDLDLEDRILFSFSFLHAIPAHGGAPQYQVWLQKVAYKHSAEWEQICVTSVTSLTPKDTPVLSLL